MASSEEDATTFTELLTGVIVLEHQAGAALQGHYAMGLVDVQGAQMRAAQTKMRHGQAQQSHWGDAQSNKPQTCSTCAKAGISPCLKLKAPCPAPEH